MTAKELEKARDKVVMIPSADKDLVIAVYNIGIAIVKQLEKNNVSNKYSTWDVGAV